MIFRKDKLLDQGGDFLLVNLSISQYAAKLASSEPAPGGGSAAALVGLLGASLLEMVIQLSLGRSQVSQYEDLLQSRGKELAQLHKELELLVDRDAEAFLRLMATYKMPSNSVDEKAQRRQAIQQAVAVAAQVPLNIARTSLAVLVIADQLLGKVNTHAVSDLVVGAQACHTGVVGALLNTAVNIPLLQDEELGKSLASDIRHLQSQADQHLAAVKTVVYAEATFGVMET
jgi:formiminotetrahydrofolate cyclodeaminase